MVLFLKYTIQIRKSLDHSAKETLSQCNKCLIQALAIFRSINSRSSGVQGFEARSVRGTSGLPVNASYKFLSAFKNNLRRRNWLFKFFLSSFFLFFVSLSLSPGIDFSSKLFRKSYRKLLCCWQSSPKWWLAFLSNQQGHSCSCSTCRTTTSDQIFGCVYICVIREL